MSSTGAELVRPPTEMRSAPSAGVGAHRVQGDAPGDLQQRPAPPWRRHGGRPGPPPRAPGRWTCCRAARRRRRRRAPRPNWSRSSHSTCTVRPGQRLRAVGHRGRRSPVRARWLSLSRIQSDRLPRWLAPPAGPHRRLLQAAQARAWSCGCPRCGCRRPRRPAPRSAGSGWRCPRGGPRKLRAVRSAVRIEASGPSHRGQRGAGRGQVAVGRRPGHHHRRIDLGEGLGGAGRARHHARRRAPRRPPRPASSGGTRAEVRSPRGVRSSARARVTASTTAARGGSSALIDGHRRAGGQPPPRAASASSTIRRRKAGSVSGWSARVWEPRLSVRCVAEASRARASSTRLASSHTAGSVPEAATSAASRSTTTRRWRPASRRRAARRPRPSWPAGARRRPASARAAPSPVRSAESTAAPGPVADRGSHRPPPVHRQAADHRLVDRGDRRPVGDVGVEHGAHGAGRLGPTCARPRWPRPPGRRTPCPPAARWRPGGWRRARPSRRPRRRPRARRPTRRRRGR